MQIERNTVLCPFEGGFFRFFSCQQQINLLSHLATFLFDRSPTVENFFEAKQRKQIKRHVVAKAAKFVWSTSDIIQNSVVWIAYMGGGCGTAVEPTPCNLEIKRLWIRILSCLVGIKEGDWEVLCSWFAFGYQDKTTNVQMCEAHKDSNVHWPDLLLAS